MTRRALFAALAGSAIARRTNMSDLLKRAPVPPAPPIELIDSVTITHEYTVDEFRQRYHDPAALALADRIDREILARYKSGEYGAHPMLSRYGKPWTTPSAGYPFHFDQVVPCEQI